MTDLAKVHVQITERRCENCACSLQVDTQLINQKAWICRKDPPFIVETRQRTVDGVVTSAEFSYKQTAPQFVCFDGWRPAGTLPGDNFISLDLVPVAEKSKNSEDSN
jgi:hypothetical protein